MGSTDIDIEWDFVRGINRTTESGSLFGAAFEPYDTVSLGERWQSGRMRRFRKPVYQQWYRGFESLPLRFIGS